MSIFAREMPSRPSLEELISGDALHTAAGRAARATTLVTVTPPPVVITATVAETKYPRGFSAFLLGEATAVVVYDDTFLSADQAVELLQRSVQRPAIRLQSGEQVTVR